MYVGMCINPCPESQGPAKASEARQRAQLLRLPPRSAKVWGHLGLFCFPLLPFASGPRFMGSAGRISRALSPEKAPKPIRPFNHFYRPLHLERMVKPFINPQKPSARESSLYYLPFCPSQAVPSQGDDEDGHAWRGRCLGLPRIHGLCSAEGLHSPPAALGSNLNEN